VLRIVESVDVGESDRRLPKSRRPSGRHEYQVAAAVEEAGEVEAAELDAAEEDESLAELLSDPPPGFLPPSRKSVTYQPEPFS